MTQTLTLASQTIVEQYVSALLDMRRTYHVYFYVHPVNAILNETRYVANRAGRRLESAPSNRGLAGRRAS